MAGRQAASIFRSRRLLTRVSRGVEEHTLSLCVCVFVNGKRLFLFPLPANFDIVVEIFFISKKGGSVNKKFACEFTKER